MILAISIFSLIHVLFYLILSGKWMLLKADNDGTATQFSVVIPVRNEQENIGNILRDLHNQTINKSQFEVIVVDDFSSDNTRNVVEDFANETDIDLKLISLEDSTQVGKKIALTKGIDEAKNDIILTTDADCKLGPSWIEAYSKVFNNSTQIVTGPVSLEGTGFFANMQMTEFAGLIAFGAVTLASNNPSMCSGANMGFRKEAFKKVGGYKSNITIPSGDDEFLLYDILKAYPNSGRFLKFKEGVVRTHTQLTFKSFLNQRSRWISKWKYNKNWKLRGTAVLFFMDYFLLLSAVAGTIFGHLSPIFLGILLISRFVANYTLLKMVSSFLGHHFVAIPLLLLQIFYPFHVLGMGVKSIFGGYTWKGRKYG